MNLRPDYINAIAPFMDKRLVKILAGVRRCGKTTILSMIERELKNRNIAPDHIISRNYSNIAYDDYTAKKMYSDLKASMNGKGRYYLLLDELQEVEGWEKVINTLLENENVDIYVTGSNSKLMSSEISTYLTGRYVSIPVFTLSFKEYLQFKGKNEDEAKTLFDEYLLYGGFPIIAISNFDTAAAYQVVDGIYATVITRDISKRHKLRNKDLFDRVVKYIVENVGKTFSANSIRNFLKSEHRSVSIESVYNYIKWLSEAFIIYPCQRYDLQGKSVLKTQEKYYLSDISLKYSQMGFNRKMVSSLLENIVYLELRRRGYDVYIGKQAAKEIDFVAIRRNERIYIQVCDQFPEDSSRETDNLINIKDHYHKYVVCRDPLALGNDNGINIVHIADFLLTDNW
ncbi:MAG: ATP-binding protein [Acidaminococcaceae bacterium]|nr:ATP-binding protein [Acidaminococcaceae bacterium]